MKRKASGDYWDASKAGFMPYKRQKGSGFTTSIYPKGRVTYAVRAAPAAPAAAVNYVPRTPGGQIVADNHYFDAELAATNILVTTTTWAGGELDATFGTGPTAMNCLFAPTQGDDITQRTGRKAFLKKIRIHGKMIVPTQSAQSGLDVPPAVRLICYMDKQTNGTQAQAEEVISSGIDTLPLNMFQSTKSFGRFKVYKDKTFILTPQTATNNAAADTIVQEAVKREFKWNINVNEWVNFNEKNTGTVSDVIDRSFHLIGVTDGAATIPNIYYKVRCTFLP